MKNALSSIAILAVVLIAGCGRSAPRKAGQVSSKPSATEEKRPVVHAKRHRVVYAYSVVAGGVESGDEVREAAARDPETAAHYAAVDVGTLRPARLSAAADAYVSFRKNGRVYWTRRKVHLAAGEPVLTDGGNCIRTRCGNRVSSTPMSPVLPKDVPEPTQVELDNSVVHGQTVDELIASPLTGELSPANSVEAELLIADASKAAAGGYVGPSAVIAASGFGGVGGGGVSGGGGETNPTGVTPQPSDEDDSASPGGLPGPWTWNPVVINGASTAVGAAAQSPGSTVPPRQSGSAWVPSAPALPDYPTITPVLPQAPGSTPYPNNPGSGATRPAPITPSGSTDTPPRQPDSAPNPNPSHGTGTGTSIPVPVPPNMTPTGNVSDTPEPGTLWLIGGGLVGFGLSSRLWRSARTRAGSGTPTGP